jgi:hypothetical protein
MLKTVRQIEMPTVVGEKAILINPAVKLARRSDLVGLIQNIKVVLKCQQVKY